ncbi:MAG TPA: hypothetical protein VF950_13985 [Planctomycetota bacterium]
MAGCGPRYTVVEPPARPFAEFGSLEVKDVELLDKKAPKDFKDFAIWLTRNARHRLGGRFSGTGPKLVVTLTLDPSGLREQAGGLITTRWEGVAALNAAFFTEQGASVARVACHAEPAKGGQLGPAGDRLLDDLLDFLASPTR